MFLLDDKQRVFEYMIRDFNTSYYASKIARELKLNQKSVSNYLSELEKENILKTKIEGKNKLFYFNFLDKNLIKNFLILIETRKNLIFMEKDIKIKNILMKLVSSFSSLALIFGSYAKGLNNSNSDLDIFVVGNYNKEKIKEVSNLYGIEINVKSTDKKTFLKLIKDKDILINELIKDHIIIKGFEIYVDSVLEEYENE